MSYHVCLSGSLTCSGCNPCEECLDLVRQLVLPSAMIAAGFNRSAEQADAFFTGYMAGWQRLQQTMEHEPQLRGMLKITDVSRLAPTDPQPPRPDLTSAPEPLGWSGWGGAAPPSPMRHVDMAAAERERLAAEQAQLQAAERARQEEREAARFAAEERERDRLRRMTTTSPSRFSSPEIPSEMPDAPLTADEILLGATPIQGPRATLGSVMLPGWTPNGGRASGGSESAAPDDAAKERPSEKEVNGVG